MGSSPNLVTPRQTFIYLFLLFLWGTFSRYLHQISAPQHSRGPLVTASKRWNVHLPSPLIRSRATRPPDRYSTSKIPHSIAAPVSYPWQISIANRSLNRPIHAFPLQTNLTGLLWVQPIAARFIIYGTRISIKGNKSISVSLGSWQFLNPTEALGFGFMLFTMERAHT